MSRLEILKGIKNSNKGTKKEADSNKLSKEMYEEVAKLCRFSANRKSATDGFLDRIICDIDGPNEEKGWTVFYFPHDADGNEGELTVAGRFKTTEEKNEFLKKVYKYDSGWTDMDLVTMASINDINYHL